jgi:pimeloyl-ACP methyl ester carboxylesterase
MHVAEAGTGPLVLLLHGFPECWYSWRHQLIALAEAGFHAVAPDQRGYGRTGAADTSGQPLRTDQYTILHLVGDVIALIDALGEGDAVIAGHDWGAPVAWAAALLRPDRVRGVAGLSVPHLPRGQQPPVQVLRSVFGDGFYIVYFQQPGRAEAELGQDLKATFRRLLTAASAAGPVHGVPVVPPVGGLLDLCPEPPGLPGWLTEADIDAYAAEFASCGFAGPLNWYRNLDRNWELTAPWQGAPVTVPALYLAGDADLVVHFSGGPAMLSSLRASVPRLREARLLAGCGHWTQQERPAEVSAALLEFLGDLA